MPLAKFPAELLEISAGRHAVIEASAGTGKTHLIEHLVLDLLIRGECPIEKILVVTFTEKATVELRARIRRRLATLASLGADEEGAVPEQAWNVNEDVRRALETALYGFDRAAFHTIHGFCRRVLSETAFESGMPFGLELTDGRAAFRAAFRAVLRVLMRDEEGIHRALIEEWLAFSSEERSRDGTRTRVDLLEELLFKAYRARYRGEGIAGEARLEGALIALEGLFNDIRLRADLEAGGLTPKGSREALEVVDAMGRAFREAQGDASLLRRRLAQLDVVPLLRPTLRKNSPRFPDDLSEPSRRFLDAVRSVFLAIPLEERILSAFLPKVEERLESGKRAAGLLDYDDMLRWLHGALQGEGGERLAATLRERYRHVLID